MPSAIFLDHAVAARAREHAQPTDSAALKRLDADAN
jgi:hypothetical protein